jgi:outer membrane protein assembly factor BamB
MSRTSRAAAAIAASVAVLFGCSAQHDASAVLPQTSSGTIGDPTQEDSVFTTAAKWAQPNHDAGHSGYNSLETLLGISNVATLALGWTFPTSNQVQSVLEVGGTVFASNGNTVYAINASTGAQKWSFTTGPGGSLGGAPNLAVDNGRVYADCSVDNQGHAGLCALNATTGRLIWSYALLVDGGGNVFDFPDNGPTVSGNDVVFAFNDSLGSDHVGYIMNLNATTGAVNWMIGNCNDDPTNNLCYTVSSYPAAIANGVVYVGSGGTGRNGFNGGTCAHKLSDGSVLWCHNSNNDYDAVSIANGTVFTMAAPNNNSEVLTAMNASTGSVKWSYTYPSGCCRNTEPAIAKGVVYVATSANNTLNALNATTGHLIWSVQAHGGSPAEVANGVVYEQSFGSGGEAFNASNGSQLWNDGGTAQGIAGVAVVNGVLYELCNYNNVCQYKLPASRPMTPTLASF